MLRQDVEEFYRVLTKAAYDDSLVKIIKSKFQDYLQPFLSADAKTSVNPKFLCDCIRSRKSILGEALANRMIDAIEDKKGQPFRDLFKNSEVRQEFLQTLHDIHRDGYLSRPTATAVVATRAKEYSFPLNCYTSFTLSESLYQEACFHVHQDRYLLAIECFRQLMESLSLAKQQETMELPKYIYAYAKALNKWAIKLQKQKLLGEALNYYRAAEDILKEVAKTSSYCRDQLNLVRNNLAFCLSERGSHYYNIAEWEKAIDYYCEALQVLAMVPKQNRINYEQRLQSHLQRALNKHFIFVMNQAVTCCEQEKLLDSLDLLRRFMEKIKKCCEFLGPKLSINLEIKRQLAAGLNAAAAECFQKKFFESAMQYLNEAIALMKEFSSQWSEEDRKKYQEYVNNLNIVHKLHLQHCFSQGIKCYDTMDYPTAVQFFRLAIKVGKQHPDYKEEGLSECKKYLAKSLFKVAKSFFCQRQFQDSIVHFEESNQICAEMKVQSPSRGKAFFEFFAPLSPMPELKLDGAASLKAAPRRKSLADLKYNATAARVAPQRRRSFS